MVSIKIFRIFNIAKHKKHILDQEKKLPENFKMSEVSPISVYIAEGEKLYKAGDYKKAMDSFNQAIELDGDNPMTYVSYF